MKVVAYIRVSTGKQEASGLGLEAQIAYIEKAAEQNGWEVVATFSEAMSGAKSPEARPECSKALALATTLDCPVIVAKLDRLSRDVEDVARIMKSHSLKVATMPTADNFQLHLFAALAEQERVFIQARIKDALNALKVRAESGCTVSIQKIANRTEAQQKGRAVACIKRADTVRMSKVGAYKDAIRPHLESALYNGARTLQALADVLTSKGHKTPRGSEFTATSIKRLLASFDLSLAA